MPTIEEIIAKLKDLDAAWLRANWDIGYGPGVTPPEDHYRTIAETFLDRQTSNPA